MRVTVGLVCKQCGREFVRRPWETRHGGHTGEYCGPACMYQARVGVPQPNLRVAPTEYMCPACGKSFLVGGRGRPTKRQVFCSDVCKYHGRYCRGAVANQLSPTDAAYIAGFVDGEGSIMLLQRKNSIRVRMTVSNTDRNVLDWLCQTVGVSNIQAHRKETAKHRMAWQWDLNGDGVASLLVQIRPYLKVKAVQADLAIEAMERLRDPVFKADHTWQDEWKEQMRKLNKRGPRDTLTASAGG